MAPEPTKQPSQVILWSQGRTACHLLERMLSKQPNTRYLWHPYAPARFAATPLFTIASTTGTIPNDTTTRSPYLSAIEQGTTAWKTALAEAQSTHQTLFIHEHPQFAIDLDRAVSHVSSEWNKPFVPPPTNFTLVPDTILLHPGTVPILTFRHPATLIPAAYRALRDAEGNPDSFNMIFISVLRWQRALYEYYAAHNITPIVVEAEDYMSSPEFVKELCVEAGLDPDAAIFKWEKVPEEVRREMPPVAVVLMKTLFDSTGIRPELAKKGEVDVKVEEEKWKGEFGDETVRLLRELVDSCMDDYEFLRAKRLRLDS